MGPNVTSIMASGATPSSADGRSRPEADDRVSSYQYGGCLCSSGSRSVK
jgi:hypothetical protein